jgi:hypothetical protein
LSFSFSFSFSSALDSLPITTINSWYFQ